VTEDSRISRRDALRKAALVGAVAWTVPTIQTVNLQRALAQTQSPPGTCTKFRIQRTQSGLPDCTSVGAESCLVDTPFACFESNQDPFSCDAISGNPQVPDDDEWVICLDEGCEVEGVGLKSTTSCLCSPAMQSPSDPTCTQQGMPVLDHPTSTWEGWCVDANNCLHIPRAKRKSNGNAIRTDHVDVIVCCPA
jgi:hypothetical protein